MTNQTSENTAVHLPIADKSCCETLARQISQWYDAGQNDEQLLMNAFATQLRKEGAVLVPVILPDSFLQTLAQVKTQEELQSLNQNIGLQSLETEDGVWYVAFTSEEEAHSDFGDTATMPFYLRQLMTIAASTEDCVGLIVNPWSEQSISIPKVGIQMILEKGQPMTTEEVAYYRAEEAYRRGNYEGLPEVLQPIAEAEFPKALTLLGDCYYYGRGIGKDKGKARSLWETAAAKEDANGAGKLADMYQNGDLEPNPGFANALYHRCFDLARKDKSIDCYPDACLRMLKYCKDDFSAEDYENLAWDAVEGFQERVAQGDLSAEKLLKSAQSYLDYLEKAKGKGILR